MLTLVPVSPCAGVTTVSDSTAVESKVSPGTSKFMNTGTYSILWQTGCMLKSRQSTQWRRRVDA